MSRTTRGRFAAFCLVVASCACGDMCHGGPRPPKPLYMHLLSESASIIVVGTVEPAERQEKSGKDFYVIATQEVLKGALPTNALLVVHGDVEFEAGSNPVIETQRSYMLFLQEAVLDSKDAPQNMICYQVVTVWRGCIPLDEHAREQRPFVFIEKDYGFDLRGRAQDFVAAMRYSLVQYNGSNGVDKANLAPGASAVYKALKLERIGKPLSAL